MYRCRSHPLHHQRGSDGNDSLPDTTAETPPALSLELDISDYTLKKYTLHQNPFPLYAI